MGRPTEEYSLNSTVHESRPESAVSRGRVSYGAGRVVGATKVNLRCERCHRVFPIAPLFTGCRNCQDEGVLSVPEVVYDFADQLNPFALNSDDDYASGCTERYKALLPVQVCDDVISLGEGQTPLVRPRRIGERLGLPGLLLKCEAANPTGSFKDRYVSVTVSLAAHFGYKRAVVASTGNLGVSTAAYCSAAGIKCVVLMSDDTPDVMFNAATNHGAIVVKSPKELRPKLLEHLVLQHDFFPVGLRIQRRVHNPFGVEAYKTIAFEIIDSVGDVDAVLFPSARGNGLYGTWKGFVEAKKFGRIKRLPAMVATQPVGANSLEESIERNAKEPVELPPITSVAFSTCETISDIKALEAIRLSNGTAVSATEDEIIQACHALYSEGLNTETSSSLPLACVERARKKLGLPADAKIVCLLTASGRSSIDLVSSGQMRQSYSVVSLEDLKPVITAAHP